MSQLVRHSEPREEVEEITGKRKTRVGEKPIFPCVEISYILAEAVVTLLAFWVFLWYCGLTRADTP